MNIDIYLAKHRKELLDLYGQIYSGRILETYINPNAFSDEEFSKSCCLDAVVYYVGQGSELDFPIKKPKNITKDNQTLANELYTIALCEEEVKLGSLKRAGFRYSPINEHDIPNIPNKRKYIIPPPSGLG